MSELVVVGIGELDPAATPAIFRFVSPANVERLNLNNLTGFFLTAAPDLGTPEVSTVWLSQMPYDGAMLASSRKGNATMTLRLALRSQVTFAAWKALVDILTVELDRPTNIIEYQPPGAEASYLIDTYRSPTPSLIADSPSINVHTNTVTFTLNIPRHPTMRGAGVHV